MNWRILAPLVGVLALVVVGCRSNPVYSPTDIPVTASTRGYALSDVRNAIVQAGASLGWQMKPVKPGLIVGTLYLRNHMAQVDIPYNRQTYSIVYRDSQNLDYDGVNIHGNYNGWVQRLSTEINQRLSTL